MIKTYPDEKTYNAPFIVTNTYELETVPKLECSTNNYSDYLNGFTV